MKPISKEKENQNTKRRTSVSRSKWKVGGRGKSSGRLSQSKLCIAKEKDKPDYVIGEISDHICRAENTSNERREETIREEDSVCFGQDIISNVEQEGDEVNINAALLRNPNDMDELETGEGREELDGTGELF